MRKRDEGLSSLCAHVPLPICTTHTDLPYRLEKVILIGELVNIITQLSFSDLSLLLFYAPSIAPRSYTGP